MKKYAGLLESAVIGHLLQNQFTRMAMKSKTVAKYLANNFSDGVKGGFSKSIGHGLLRGALGVAVPDVAIAAKKIHEAGVHIGKILPKTTQREKVGLRMISEGRFQDLHKYGLSKHPAIKSMMEILGQRTGISPDKLMDSQNARKLEDVWHDKKYPLLSNISSMISRGHPSKNLRRGSFESKDYIISSLGGTIAEPGVGIYSLSKHLATSKTFIDNKYGKKISDFLTTHLVKNPISRGFGNHTASNLGQHFSEHLLNPTSVHLERTTAALRKAIKS